MRILVVEDERKLAQVLASALQTEHYDVVVAPTGEDGFFRANAEAFDLVVLDLMLPGRGGLEQLDDRLHEDFETAEGRLTWTADGRVQWIGPVHADEHGEEARVYEVWSVAGEHLHRSGSDVTLPPLALSSARRIATTQFPSMGNDGARSRHP